MKNLKKYQNAAQTLLDAYYYDIRAMTGMAIYHKDPHKMTYGAFETALRSIVDYERPEEKRPYDTDTFLKKMYEQKVSPKTQYELTRLWLAGEYKEATAPLDQTPTGDDEETMYDITVKNRYTGRVLFSSEGNEKAVGGIASQYHSSPNIAVYAVKQKDE
jgi:hypothetical protein